MFGYVWGGAQQPSKHTIQFHLNKKEKQLKREMKLIWWRDKERNKGGMKVWNELELEWLLRT